MIITLQQQQDCSMHATLVHENLIKTFSVSRYSKHLGKQKNTIQLIIAVSFLFLSNIAKAQNNIESDSLKKDSIQIEQQQVRLLMSNPERVVQTGAVSKYVNDSVPQLEKSSVKKDKPKTNLICYYPDEYIAVQMNKDGITYAEKCLDSIRLWMNGICYPQIKPLFIDHASSSLVFKIIVDTSVASPWQLFYAYPNYWTFHRPVQITLGTITKQFSYSIPQEINLYTTSWWMLAIAYSIFALAVIVILTLGKGMLRDTGTFKNNGYTIIYDNTPIPIGAVNTVSVKQIPFSLAKFQFLFWLVIIFFGITHIWGITDVLTTPTGTVLILLGISGGTFYIGKIIDTTPNQTATGANPNPIAKLDLSKSFIYDILSDGNTISLHRLQLMMFTVFLGVYFVWEVIYSLSLPQFSATMLTLMGISSGTYAGMKTTENK